MSAKVFTTVAGLVANIGGYGLASNDVPAIVPDAVADQFEDEIRGYREVPDPEDASKKIREAFGRGPSTHLRVEREKPAKAVAAPKAKAEAAPEEKK
jgi:hypothetical protein